MEKIDKDTRNILIGALIGGVIGVCGASLLESIKHKKQGKSSTLSSVGKVVVHLGELLNDEDVKHTPGVKNLEKVVRDHETTIADVLDIIASGVHLWDQIKRR